MDKNDCGVSVPYVVYESTMTRAERSIKRLIIALIVSVVLLFLSNALWLHEWCQYDYVSEDSTTTTSAVYQQDGAGVNIIGDGNEANNGAESNNHENNTDPQKEQD